MNTKIYLRKTKNNQEDFSEQTICIRVRDGKLDLRAVTPLSMPTQYWDSKVLGYSAKTPTELIAPKARKEFNKQLLRLVEFVNDRCSDERDRTCLKEIIADFFKNGEETQTKQIEEEPKEEPPYPELLVVDTYDLTFSQAVTLYLDRNVSRQHIGTTKGIANKISRFIVWQREINEIKDYELYIEDITPVELSEIRDYIYNEYLYYKDFPDFYKQFKIRKCDIKELSANVITATMARIMFVLNWCVKMDLMKNRRYQSYDHGVLVYGSPYYLTLEERDKIYEADMSQWPKLLQDTRDKFIFQCMVGCRVSDLQRLTKSNIVNGFLEYIPNKTKSKGIGETIRVPLNEKARTILARQNTGDDKLFVLHSRQSYNSTIHLIMQLLGINRIVTILNRHTHKEEQKPLYELATSHMARRTFIGNLYKKVKDQELIGSMSGHCPGSKAFKRYRNIDDEMKQELVDMID